jgi:hypothetical protein
LGHLGKTGKLWFIGVIGKIEKLGIISVVGKTQVFVPNSINFPSNWKIRDN